VTVHFTFPIELSSPKLFVLRFDSQHSSVLDHKELRRFAIIAGIAGLPSDQIIKAVLRDDRVPRQLPQLMEKLHDSLSFLTLLPKRVWDVLAPWAGYAGRPFELRAEVMLAAMVGVSYGILKSMRAAGEMPWRLVQGDIKTNLVELKEMPAPPEDPSGTTRKIWKRLQLGESPDDLVDVVDHLIGNISWSTVGIEQVIGALSTIKKWHKKRYGKETLGARGLMKAAYPTVRPAFELSKKKKVLDAEIAGLQQKRPLRCSGRHLALGRNAGSLRRRLGASWTIEEHDALFQANGEEWRHYSPGEQHAWKGLGRQRIGCSIFQD
jgi:hypothetical protein